MVIYPSDLSVDIANPDDISQKRPSDFHQISTNISEYSCLISASLKQKPYDTNLSNFSLVTIAR